MRSFDVLITLTACIFKVHMPAAAMLVENRDNRSLGISLSCSDDTVSGDELEDKTLTEEDMHPVHLLQTPLHLDRGSGSDKSTGKQNSTATVEASGRVNLTSQMVTSVSNQFDEP